MGRVWCACGGSSDAAAHVAVVGDASRRRVVDETHEAATILGGDAQLA